jgi:hypothetical protein
MSTSSTITTVASVAALAGIGVMAAAVAIESFPVLIIASGVAALASSTGIVAGYKARRYQDFIAAGTPKDASASTMPSSTSPRYQQHAEL